MFEDVMNGKAVGFPDFMLPLNKDGFVEECYFDFSYSPIRKQDGEVGGVLVTVIETTNKKKAHEYRWLLIQAIQRLQPNGTFAGLHKFGSGHNRTQKCRKGSTGKEQNLRNTIIQAPVAMCLFKGQLFAIAR